MSLCCAPSCYRRDAEMFGTVPLCASHLEEVRTAIGLAEPAPMLADTTIVYYMAWSDSDLIKIGTTTDLIRRLDGLRWEMNRPGRRAGQLGDPRPLATERGGHALERARHKQFRHLRVTHRSELFRPGDDLLAHIAGLNSIRQELNLTR